MNIETVKISTVKTNPNNPRVIKDEKFEQLVQSIKDFPKMLEIRPIVVNDEMIVLGGNMRLKACKEAGLKEVHIIKASDLTEEQQREFIIKDNVGFGKWDWEQLKEWDGEELEAWGLDVPVDETDEVLEAEEDDFDATPPEEPITVLGDLYEIGEHRLLCGDSTDSDQVAKLMNGEKADMVFTDPPYDMQMKGGCVGDVAKNMRKVEKDIEFISKFNPTEFLNGLPLVFDSKKMNSYIFCNKDLVPKYLNFAVENKYSFNILIWKKPNAIPLGDSHYPDVEYLLLFRKSAIWNNSVKGVNYSRCLEFGREKGLHPTMKPIELISNEMKISSNENSIIVDFFLGSGSTMVASHQLKRKCYGMELDPKYCDVIVKRMLKLDDTLMVKRNGIDCKSDFE
jgi:site-specific DNA-methyltransferase (adenine-specific)